MKKTKKTLSNDKFNFLLQRLLLNLLAVLPALIGFGIILTTTGPLSSLVLGLGSFIAGFTGIIVIIRKEVPVTIVPITGKLAIIEGAAFTVLCWGASFYFWIAQPV